VLFYGRKLCGNKLAFTRTHTRGRKIMNFLGETNEDIFPLSNLATTGLVGGHVHRRTLLILYVA
jgi:hypothetical protein